MVPFLMKGPFKVRSFWNPKRNEYVAAVWLVTSTGFNIMPKNAIVPANSSTTRYSTCARLSSRTNINLQVSCDEIELIHVGFASALCMCVPMCLVCVKSFYRKHEWFWHMRPHGVLHIFRGRKHKLCAFNMALLDAASTWCFASFCTDCTDFPNARRRRFRDCTGFSRHSRPVVPQYYHIRAWYPCFWGIGSQCWSPGHQGYNFYELAENIRASA